MRSPERLALIAWRSWSASLGVNPAASIAMCIICSWNKGTPRVFLSERSSDGWGASGASRP
jgi:hypothetical protein